MLCWTCHDRGFIRVQSHWAGDPVALDACPECTVRAEYAWRVARCGVTCPDPDPATGPAAGAATGPAPPASQLTIRRHG